MMKSLVLGVAAFFALTFVTPAHVFAKQQPRKHHPPVRNAEVRGDANTRRPYPTHFRIPADPLIWDCVHVMFPQCSGRGYNNLNDGSYQ